MVVGKAVGYVQPGAVHEETFGRVVVQVAAGAGAGIEDAESFGGLKLVVVVAGDAISVFLEGPAPSGPAQPISSQLVSQQTFGAGVFLSCASVVDNSVRNAPSITVQHKAGHAGSAGAIEGHLRAVGVVDQGAETVAEVVPGEAGDADLLVVGLAVGVLAEVVGEDEGGIAFCAGIVEGDEDLTPQTFAAVELKNVEGVALDAVGFVVVAEAVGDGPHADLAVVLDQQSEPGFAVGAVELTGKGLAVGAQISAYESVVDWEVKRSATRAGPEGVAVYLAVGDSFDALLRIESVVVNAAETSAGLRIGCSATGYHFAAKTAAGQIVPCHAILAFSLGVDLTIYN